MDNNIALITALFNEKGSNFYKDIYFPIIKYSLVNLFLEHEENERYFQILDLQEYIKNKFCIDIPVVVLRNSVVALRGSAQTDIVVQTLGEHGDSLFLKRIDNSRINEDVDKQAEANEDNFLALERLFEQYLDSEKLDSAKKLYDFVSECEEECYAMIAGDDASQAEGLDANFSNIARFIEWIKINRTDLYQYFTDIVWGAVISGFLRRESFDFNIKPSTNVVYYLDSALVLSLLHLDTGYNVAYANDVIRNVKASGGVVKIHAITIREVTRILESVIHEEGPRFGSAISFGFTENKMSLSDIVRLKNSLVDILIKDFGVVIESIKPQELKTVEEKLRHNKNVLFLKDKWGGYSNDLFRETHDVFMCEMVNKNNSNVFSFEKLHSFFVTLNRDLIELYHKPDGLSCVITPGNVVLKLWINNKSSSDIRGTLLTEIVSRCMALAQTDARRKIKLFFKYRKATEFPSDDVKDMYSGLIHRSNRVIMQFEELEKLDRSETEDKVADATVLMAQIMEGVRVDAQERHKLFEDSTIVTEKLKDNVALLEKNIKIISEDKDNKDVIIESLQKENSENQLIITQLREAIEIQKEEKRLNDIIGSLSEKKKQMEKDKDKSLNMSSYWIILFLDIILLLALIIFSFILIKNYRDNKTIELNLTTILTTISLLGFLFRVRDAYWLKPIIKYYQCRNEQALYWEQKNPQYGDVKNQIIENEKQLKSLKFKGSV